LSKVNHPKHYNEHPSGVECIDIIKHMNWCLGSAIKYIWRADLKDNDIEDLEKAIFCIQQEIDKRNGESEEESARELEQREYPKSDHALDALSFLFSWGKANNEEGSLFYSEHLLQHLKAREDNHRASRT
jgi:hypothetical protein